MEEGQIMYTIYKDKIKKCVLLGRPTAFSSLVRTKERFYNDRWVVGFFGTQNSRASKPVIDELDLFETKSDLIKNLLEYEG